MKINPFAISGLLVGLTCTGLTIIIFNGKEKIHKLYGLHTFSVAIWGYGSFLIGLTTNSTTSLILWKIASSAVIFIPIFFLHVVLIFLNKHRRLLLFFAYLQGFIFTLLNIFGILWGPLKYIFNSFYYPLFTWFSFALFLIWTSLVIYEHYDLLKSYIKTEKESRKQNFYFFLATLIGFGGGVTNYIPCFGINFYPYGNFGIPFYCIIIAYAILKHHLMDINVVIRKGLVYSILITVFTVIYLSIVIFTERLFQGIFGYRSILISVIFASIIAVVFIPLKNKIQSFIDRIFLGKTPEQIAKENELLRQELLRSEKLKAVAALASGMAHEIKNPLTAIKTFAEFLPQKLEDKDFIGKFSKIVGSEVEKIDDLVHQLLDFSKPGPLQLKETNLHKLIDDTLELLSSQFIKYRINVIKEYNTNIHKLHTNGHESIREDLGVIRDNSCLINIDPNQIKQVFLNLFLNSIEVMPNGGTLTVSTNLRSSGNNSVLICVQDTGCGISEKDLPHIFEPFYSTKEKGSGLGLSIVYNIIREHKGSIKVESEINEGARFIIELPIL